MATTRPVAEIAADIQKLETSFREGAVPEAAHRAAKSALMAEMVAATRGEVAQDAEPAEEDPNYVEALGYIRLVCSSCGTDDDWMQCTICGMSDSFGVTRDGTALCSCCARFTHAFCACGARIPSRDFGWSPRNEGPPRADEDEIEALDELADPSATETPGLGAIIGVGVAVAGFLAVCCGGLGDGSGSAAREAVLARLKAPSTAEFVSTEKFGEGEYYVVVDAQNGFGAAVRSGFCVALPESGQAEQVFECSRTEAQMVFNAN